MKNFPFFYHARMLADEQRLRQFKKAIFEIVSSETRVVDLGAGTGVLSKFLLEKTQEKLSLIEMNSDSLEMAKLLNPALEGRADFYSQCSFDISVDNPQCLVSETLGYLGVDEGIVEITHDFCQRHPSIRSLIPSEVSVFYQLLRVDRVEEEFERGLEAYHRHFGSLPNDVRSQFEALVGNVIRSKLLRPEEASELSAPCLIRSFLLGQDSDSEIQTQINLPSDQKANVLHLFFRAKLSEAVVLDNAYSSPPTHWLHNYCRIPSERNRVELSYRPVDRRFRLRWHAV